MPFFDIVDDVTRQNFNRNEMGDTRITGILLGVVVKNYDKKKQGFILVNLNTRDYEENKMVWARVTLPYGGDKWGDYFVPEVGDQVLVTFEQGNIERAFVVGAVPKSSSEFMKKAFDEKNQYKRITTKNGNTIDIVDHKEGEGEKDKISLYTSKEKHKIVLDNENKKILITDKEGKNKIQMKTEDGQMEIIASQKLTIKVGDNIKLIMNGANGTVTLEATKLKMTTTESTEVKSNSRMTMEGGNVSVKGNSMVKVSSSGPVSVEGTPIKLG